MKIAISNRRSIIFKEIPRAFLKDNYIANTDLYVQEFDIFVNRKRRRIVTYKLRTMEGLGLREAHRDLAEMLEQVVVFRPCSYAYQKGKGTIDCISRHMNSEVFLKADIHAFFNSIDYYTLKSAISREIKPVVYANAIKALLPTCFYNGIMPLGYITSPILSDIYLANIDRHFMDRPGIIYTRYADDFIISASGPNAEKVLQEVREELESMLADRMLTLNQKKTYIRRLKQPGDAIHLLGLNLVYVKPGVNRITVSDRYIRQVSKEFCDLINGEVVPSAEFDEIFGKIAYIDHSSRSSSHKLQRMLTVKLGIPVSSLSRESIFSLSCQVQLRNNPESTQ